LNVGPAAVVGEWIRKMQENVGGSVPARPPDQPALPTLPEVLATSINIMQVRIARSRMAGEPPDVTVAPRLAHLRLLDFHRAKEAIEEGHRAVERAAHALALLRQRAG
jgi:NTE family protein